MGEESGAGTAGVLSIKRQERRTKAALIYFSLASAEPGATAAPPDELTWIYVSTVANDYFAYTLTQRRVICMMGVIAAGSTKGRYGLHVAFACVASDKIIRDHRF